MQTNRIIDAPTAIIASYDDLQKLLDEEIAAARLKAFLNRWDNVIVDTQDIAKWHSVNKQTVLNYINDGLIVPEMRPNSNGHPRFRASYLLGLDFKELQSQLRARNKGIKNKTS